MKIDSSNKKQTRALEPCFRIINRSRLTTQTRWLGAALTLAVLVPTSARSQDYSLERSSVRGGGGKMSGGSFEAQGSIGQHDAGPARGGAFSVEGGHWSLISLVETGKAPPLELVRVPGSGALVLKWPLSGGEVWRLETSTTLGQEPSVWQEVSSESHESDGTHRFIRINNPTGRRFYRLVKP